jgi:hypothetical protein
MDVPVKFFIYSLLRRIVEEARGVVVSHNDITAVAYEDDINYIIQDDEEFVRGCSRR